MFWLTYKRAIIRQLDTNGNYTCVTPYLVLVLFAARSQFVYHTIYIYIYICKHTCTYNTWWTENYLVQDKCI